MKKNKLRNYLLNILLVISLSLFVLWLSFKDNYQEIITMLSNVNIWYLLLCVIVVFLIQGFVGLALTLLTSLSNPHYRLRDGFLNALVASFFHGITPSSSGGQFAQVYVFKKQNVEICDSASVLWMDFIIYQGTMVFVVLCLLIIRFAYFERYFSNLLILVLLGFLIIIHEGGHFLVAKLCKVKVKEFAIGFGKIIWQKQGKETKYTLRLIPLGGFCNMEGEEEESDDEGSFSKASIWKKMAIVLAGATVNILFGILVYFILMSTVLIQFADPARDTILNRLYYGAQYTGTFILSIFDSVKTLFTGGLATDQMVGIVGISEVVVQTTGILNYIYLLAIISVSLGVTNLLPIPALDGGKILILLIEAIRRKPMKLETEVKIQLIGFSILFALFIFVTYNDILRIGRRFLIQEK